MEISRNRNNSISPQKGAIVLVSDPILPRNEWRMARITDLKPSTDGTIREVELVTAVRRKIRRPPNLLVPLEINSNTASSTKERKEPREAAQHRYNLRPRKNLVSNVNAFYTKTSTFKYSPALFFMLFTIFSFFIKPQVNL